MAREREAAKRVAEGIYKRGGRYLVPIHHPPTATERARRKWHTLPAGTTLAQAKKAKRELEAAKGEQQAHQETIGEFYERWAERFPHRKESTVRHNTERVKPFAREYGDRPLGEFTKAEAHDWALAHPSNYQAVRAMFSDARDMELCTANPFSNLRLPQPKGRRNIKVLTEDEINRLVQTARRVHGEYGEHFADLILTAAWTGLRPGELFALIPERVDLDEGIIHVEESADNKTGRVWSLKTENADRQVVILPEAEKPLRRVLEQRDGEEFLFQPQRPRTLLYADGVASMRGVNFAYYWHPVRDAFTDGLPESHWLRRRIRTDGVKGKLVLYECRHTFGTRLAQAGVSPMAIADQMGHKDGGQLAMEVYCHLSREDVHAGIRKLFAA